MRRFLLKAADYGIDFLLYFVVTMKALVVGTAGYIIKGRSMPARVIIGMMYTGIAVMMFIRPVIITYIVGVLSTAVAMLSAYLTITEKRGCEYKVYERR